MVLLYYTLNEKSSRKITKSRIISHFLLVFLCLDHCRLNFREVRLLSKDPDFQLLTQQLQEAKDGYLALIRKLPPKQQEIIEDYIALCEETEYQKTCAAYYCGKRNG